MSSLTVENKHLHNLYTKDSSTKCLKMPTWNDIFAILTEKVYNRYICSKMENKSLSDLTEHGLECYLQQRSWLNLQKYIREVLTVVC